MSDKHITLDNVFFKMEDTATADDVNFKFDEGVDEYHFNLAFPSDILEIKNTSDITFSNNRMIVSSSNFYVDDRNYLHINIE